MNKKSYNKNLFFTIGLMMIFAVSANAGDVAVLKNFSDQMTAILNGKIGALGIAGIAIASVVMAWKNATWGPLAWGAVAAIGIATASDIGTGLADINISTT